MRKKLRHVNRRLSDQERQRHAAIRAESERQIPPKPTAAAVSPPGIPTRLRQAREARGLTWYALARLAGLRNPGTIRDVERGKDVKLSHVEAIATALGLTLDLVEQPA